MDGMKVTALATAACAAFAAASLVLSACAREPVSAPGYLVRDSAGVEIIRNIHRAWTSETAWRVSETPTVTIGAANGDPSYELFRVRDARRLPDGRIAVTSSGTGELRLYDQSGAHLLTTGGFGDGPAEFQTPSWTRPLAGDSLLVYDLGRWGGSIMGPDMRFARSFRLLPPEGSGQVFGFDVLQSGVVIGKSEHLPRGYALGLDRAEDTYFFFSSTGELVGSIGPFPGEDKYVRTLGEGGTGPRLSGSPPFGREPSAVARGDELCVGLADTYEVSCYSSDGTLVQSIRREVAPRPVRDDDFERYVSRRLSRISNEEERHRSEPRIRQLPTPETIPPYDTLLVDADLNIWVRELPVDEVGRYSWSVFDFRGRMLGTLELPLELRITQVGDDFVLGIWRNELDVEFVRMHELIKP